MPSSNALSTDASFLSATVDHSVVAAGQKAPDYTPPFSSSEATASLTARLRRQNLGESSILGEPAVSDQRIKVIWGTNIVVRDCIVAFKHFLQSFTLGHRKIAEGQSLSPDLSDTTPLYPRLLAQIRDTEVFILNLDMQNVRCFQETASLYQQMLMFPQEIIPLMDIVTNELFVELFSLQDNTLLSQAAAYSAEPIQVRPFNCGKSINMRELNPVDIDQLVCVKGMVIRASNIIPDMRSAFFRCFSCAHSLFVENVRGKIAPPARCPREECRATQSMEIIHNRCIFSNKQILRVQETPDICPNGQTPHHVSMCVYDSLVDVARPGDKIEVTGIYRAAPVRVSERQRKLKAQFRTFIDVVHIKRSASERLAALLTAAIEGGGEDSASLEDQDAVKSQNELRIKEMVHTLAADSSIYERLAKSIAPSIYGLLNVKKALLLQLLGGVSKTVANGTISGGRLRGDINILLAGDPGVSKSQLLQYIHKLSPRGIYTSGKGSSAVGLTAYITRDPESRQLVLESGALVLSDGGVCCIDEFDKMNDSTRAILHEVMEQQTISVAKAGIITTLNARTSVLASANPVDSKYNQKKSIVENLNLPPTLLSRFDVICLLMDNPDEEQDRRISKHIISLYGDAAAADDFAADFIDVKTLTEYISYCRRLEPLLSEAAMKDLLQGYLAMRKMNGSGSGKTVSATTRQLESLIRLAEAHAKMRLSESVDSVDVAEAIRLMREAILTYAIDPLTGRIDMDLINTGKSHAAREQAVALKKQVKNFMAPVNSTIDFAFLLRELSASSPLLIPERMLRDVLAELAEEDFLLVVGNAPLKSGNPQLRRII